MAELTAFTLSGFTTACKYCAEWTEQHRTSSCLHNHDWFNALTETEKEKWFAFILNRSCRQSRWHDRSSSETRAPNALSALANKACQVIVSCLTVKDRTSLDWARLFKNRLSALIKLPGVMTPFFILSLMSWMWLWLQLSIHIQICIKADVLICWIKKKKSSLSPVSNCCQSQTELWMQHNVHFYWLSLPCNTFFLFSLIMNYYFSLLFSFI